MNALTTEIEGTFNLDLQYYAKVDFSGFKDIVDAIGGVEVEVEEAIYDATYPADYGIGFDPFYIEEGLQTLDGDTALRYVRSRHTTLDFGRAARQQQVITAIKDKALSTGFLLSPGKIKGLYSAVSENFETNMSLTEILYLAKISENFERDSIHSAVITEMANEVAGFLYTPLLEDYGGAYVLIPYTGDNRELEKYTHYFLFEPNIYDNKTEIVVLNGTKNAGLAALVKMHLVRYGFNVVEFANAEDREQLTTKIYIEDSTSYENDETMETFNKLYDFIPYSGGTNTESTGSTDRIIIEIGEDFMDYYNANEDMFYEGYY
jgi:LCP family protein required for cell wall assembly